MDIGTLQVPSQPCSSAAMVFCNSGSVRHTVDPVIVVLEPLLLFRRHSVESREDEY